MKNILEVMPKKEETKVTPPNQPQKIVESVRKWGCSSSEAVLEPGFEFYRAPNIPGFIGYRRKLNYAFVYGDPICPQNKKEELALAFENYCKEQELKVLYVLVTEKFARWAINTISPVMIEVGKDLVFYPQNHHEEGSENSKLRNQFHHAQHIGQSVEEYIPLNQEIEKQIVNFGKQWEDTREGPQLYLGPVNFFDNREGKRWFYVKQEEQILGVALLCKMEARNGWFLKFLMIASDAPRGTSELLMMSVLEKLRNENCPFLTNGMLPNDNLGEIVGLNKFSSWLARKVFNTVNWYFKLNQRKSYWQKYHPGSENTYILFSEQSLGLKDIYNLIKTLKMKI